MSTLEPVPQLSVAYVKDRLRHAPIFKLPRVRTGTTRFKSSFVNYAVDQ